MPSKDVEGRAVFAVGKRDRRCRILVAADNLQPRWRVRCICTDLRVFVRIRGSEQIANRCGIGCGDACAEGAKVRIRVDRDDSVTAQACKRGAQAHGCRRLANAALHADNSDVVVTVDRLSHPLYQLALLACRR